MKSRPSNDLQNFARTEESNFMIFDTMSGAPGQQVRTQDSDFSVTDFLLPRE